MTLPLIEITRARIGAQPGLDVSVETSTGLGRRLAPPAAWETFRASGMLPDDAYRERYEELLGGIPERVYGEKPESVQPRSGWLSFAMGVNGKAEPLRETTLKGFSLKKLPTGKSSRKPRRFAPGSFTPA